MKKFVLHFRGSWFRFCLQWDTASVTFHKISNLIWYVQLKVRNYDWLHGFEVSLSKPFSTRHLQCLQKTQYRNNQVYTRNVCLATNVPSNLVTGYLRCIIKFSDIFFDLQFCVNVI